MCKVSTLKYIFYFSQNNKNKKPETINMSEPCLFFLLLSIYYGFKDDADHM